MGFCKAVESMFDSSPKQPTQLETFLDQHGLSDVAQAIIRASGATTLEDLHHLDSEGIQALVKDAGLKPVQASKLRKALKELKTEL